MKTVNVKTKAVEFQAITLDEFNQISSESNLFFGIVKDEKDRPTHSGKSKWSLMRLDSASKIAKEHRQLVVSDLFWLEPNVSGFLIFNTETEEYKLRIEKKVKTPTVVSDKVFAECLRDIADQKRQDMEHRWSPTSPDYYRIENWTFNIQDGKLVY